MAFRGGDDSAIEALLRQPEKMTWLLKVSLSILFHNLGTFSDCVILDYLLVRVRLHPCSCPAQNVHFVFLQAHLRTHNFRLIPDLYPPFLVLGLGNIRLPYVHISMHTD